MPNDCRRREVDGRLVLKSKSCFFHFFHSSLRFFFLKRLHLFSSSPPLPSLPSLSTPPPTDGEPPPPAATAGLQKAFEQPSRRRRQRQRQRQRRTAGSGPRRGRSRRARGGFFLVVPRSFRRRPSGPQGLSVVVVVVDVFALLRARVQGPPARAEESRFRRCDDEHQGEREVSGERKRERERENLASPFECPFSLFLWRRKNASDFFPLGSFPTLYSPALLLSLPRLLKKTLEAATGPAAVEQRTTTTPPPSSAAPPPTPPRHPPRALRRRTPPPPPAAVSSSPRGPPPPPHLLPLLRGSACAYARRRERGSGLHAPERSPRPSPLPRPRPLWLLLLLLLRRKRSRHRRRRRRPKPRRRRRNRRAGQ